MSKLQALHKRTSRSPLRDGFLDEIDKMSYDDLKLITRQCICNLKDATNSLTNSEIINNNNTNYSDEKKRILENYKNLLEKIQHCSLRGESSNHLKVSEFINFDNLPNPCEILEENTNLKQHKVVELSTLKPYKPLNSNVFNENLDKHVDCDEEILAYSQKLNKTSLKTIDALRAKLKTRTQQWQVTLNLYLKEKYEYGQGLTTLEKIAKEKYKAFHREISKKKMQEPIEKLDKDSCIIT